ncbi:MAG TPA: Bro-N domain-containing protein, partial [Roseiarcus sp.]|nr:Bro-N domain-containing protein [Roseiarcus sp.]
IKDGEPWFIANDVCKALKLSHLRGALSACDNDEKAVISAETSKGVQSLTIVNESGLYRLTFTTRNPEGKRFRQWIATKVLPAVRKIAPHWRLLEAAPF